MDEYYERESSAFLMLWLKDGVPDVPALTSAADRVHTHKRTRRRSLSFDFLEASYQEVDWTRHDRLLSAIRDARDQDLLEGVDLVLSVHRKPVDGIVVPVRFLAEHQVIDEMWIDAEYPGIDDPKPPHVTGAVSIYEVSGGALSGYRAEYRGRDDHARQVFFDGELRRFVAQTAPGSTLVVEFRPDWGKAGVILAADLIEEIAKRGAQLLLKLGSRAAEES